MKRRKRETEVSSLSFLDCICCGFGAVLLLFVLTVGKKSDTLIDIKAKIAVSYTHLTLPTMFEV